MRGQQLGRRRQRLLALIRCELQSIMGGTGEAMAVLVYEWRSLSPEGQTYILGLRDIYEDMWLQVLGGRIGLLAAIGQGHQALRRADLDEPLCVGRSRIGNQRP